MLTTRGIALAAKLRCVEDRLARFFVNGKGKTKAAAAPLLMQCLILRFCQDFDNGVVFAIQDFVAIGHGCRGFGRWRRTTTILHLP
eukprot:scaffold2102_cov161-Amphora_coffeaeformis.AAC.39